MKSILITTEIFDVGGLETHVKGEIVALSRAGCAVHLATGSQFSHLLLPKEVATVTTGLSFGPQATTRELVIVVEILRSIIKEHDIECVHAHPFISILPSFIAAEIEGIPFCLTLHGPASIPDCYGPMYDFLFRTIVLPHTLLVIAVSAEVADLVSPFIVDGSLVVIPNGVDLSSATPTPDLTDFGSKWLIAGRLDSFKIHGVFNFIKMSFTAGLPGIVLVGDGPARKQLEQLLDQDSLLDFVELLGSRSDVPALMRSVAGIAGMGRVVLEGLASKKPVFLVGYDGVKGLIDQGLFWEAAHANFSGRNLESIDDETFRLQIEHARSVDVEGLYEIICESFSEPVLWNSFLDLTRKVCPGQRQTLLGDLFRKNKTELETEEIPFLQSTLLLERIGLLIHSDLHANASELACFNQLRGTIMESKLTQTITDLNDQIEHLSETLTERDRQIESLNVQLNSVLESRSWKITQPLRLFLTFIRNPASANESKTSLLKLCIRLYRRLPLPSRVKSFLSKVFYRLTGKTRADFNYDVISLAGIAANNLTHIQPYFGVRRPHGKRRAAILTNQLLDWNDGRQRYGGGERYALEFARLLRELHIEVTFFQPTLQERSSGDYYSFPVEFVPLGAAAGEFQFGACSSFTEITADYDHVYYHLPEYASGKVREDGLMTCHGIWFDHNNYEGAIYRTPEWFDHLYRAFQNPSRVISVDTNSIGVIRSLWPELSQKMSFIPNFYDGKLYYPDQRKRSDNRLTVLFPRRSQINRGSRIFADIVSRIPYDVEIVWLGEGDPVDTKIIMDVCNIDNRVSFRTADFDEMPGWYQKADIAVIPTIACEGTSLSCIEALACGCAVIATNVGGLPDLILNGLNGLLVDPEPVGIANAINRLIEDTPLRESLQRSASETAVNFELKMWRARWVGLLRSCAWINDETYRQWFKTKTAESLMTHYEKSEKWIILTRNAIHGGVESIIREESKLLNAPVVVCGGQDNKSSCPFIYSRADDPGSLIKAISNYDVILYHWLPDWAVSVIRESDKTSIEFVHRTDTSDCDKTVPTALITHSAFLANYIYNAYGRMCRVLDHPIALDLFAPKPHLGNCVGAITSYYETKGIDVFIRAWALIKDDFKHLNVRFYGAGDDLHKFEKLAKELRVDADFREPTKEPWRAMEEFCCFVVPSRIEGLPVAILEALSMNIPVVASALPGMLEFNELSIKRGYGQYIDLALPDNPTDLARIIRSSLEKDGRPKSREYIHDFYSPEKHCSDLIGVLREVCHR